MIRNYTLSSKNSQRLITSNNIKNKSISLKSFNKSSLLGVDNILSKTSAKITDEDFKELAIQQAKKDAENGVFQGDELKKLRESYMSVVSPDRKNMIRNAVSNTNLFPMNIKHSSGNVNSGFVVASYTPDRGWISIGTPAESKRSSEISRIYNEAWNKAYYGNGNKEKANAYDKVIIESNGFDKKA